jgi:hypothetical protein
MPMPRSRSTTMLARPAAADRGGHRAGDDLAQCPSRGQQQARFLPRFERRGPAAGRRCAVSGFPAPRGVKRFTARMAASKVRVARASLKASNDDRVGTHAGESPARAARDPGFSFFRSRAFNATRGPAPIKTNGCPATGSAGWPLASARWFSPGRIRELHLFQNKMETHPATVLFSPLARAAQRNRARHGRFPAGCTSSSTRQPRPCPTAGRPAMHGNALARRC